MPTKGTTYKKLSQSEIVQLADYIRHHKENIERPDPGFTCPDIAERFGEQMGRHVGSSSVRKLCRNLGIEPGRVYASPEGRNGPAARPADLQRLKDLDIEMHDVRATLRVLAAQNYLLAEGLDRAWNMITNDPPNEGVDVVLRCAGNLEPEPDSYDYLRATGLAQQLAQKRAKAAKDQKGQ